MFFYKIRTTRRSKAANHGRRSSATTEYMEALKPEYVGEKVARLLGAPSVVRVTAEPISQATYRHATGGR